jgi:lipopolysaccharide/colanic/teichoic acid biosynthesis glycosyltransferase
MGERDLLIEKLYEKYGHENQRRRKLTFFRKKYGWLLVVEATKLLKRGVDLFVAASMLFLLSPLLLSTALIIKFQDGGPILYISRRVGKWGKEFDFPKFRSMVLNADKIKGQLIDQNDHGGSVTFKMKNDPRTTSFGRFIRKFSIDELPQLWCVLKGEMSLVGPRPPLPEEVALYSMEDRRRLDTTPGLTCFWQVRGRGEIPFDQQVKLDLQYIESQSLFVDLWILLKTIPAVLLGKGAF